MASKVAASVKKQGVEGKDCRGFFFCPSQRLAQVAINRKAGLQRVREKNRAKPPP